MLLKLIASALAVLLLLEPENAAKKREADESKSNATAATSSTKTTEEKTAEEQARPDDPAQAEAKSAESQPEAKSEPKKPKDGLIEVERNIVEKTNAQRARHGLPPLVVDRTLVQSARTHAAWMTNRRTLTHTSRPVAENIAMGQRTSGEAVSSWMNSSGHRANILSRGHRRIGVAAYRTPEGTIYWCQQFLP